MHVCIDCSICIMVMDSSYLCFVLFVRRMAVVFLPLWMGALKSVQRRKVQVFVLGFRGLMFFGLVIQIIG